MTQMNLSLTHLVRQPLVRTDAKPPLLLLLHGVGSNEADLFALANDLDPRWLVVSPRSPMALPNGGYGWYPVNFTADGPVIDPGLFKRGQGQLIDFITEAKTAYDVGRVYLMGFSQGAIMSVNTLLTQPELIDGVVAMSGRIYPDIMRDTWVTDAERLRDFPVMAVHGTLDTVLPVALGRELRDHLQSLPVNLTYREYEMAHTISMASLADVQAWLKNQLDAMD